MHSQDNVKTLLTVTVSTKSFLNRHCKYQNFLTIVHGSVNVRKQQHNNNAQSKYQKLLMHSQDNVKTLLTATVRAMFIVHV